MQLNLINAPSESKCLKEILTPTLLIEKDAALDLIYEEDLE